MSSRKQSKPVQPIRLYETQFVGRLETIEQVQALMQSLDDLKPGLGWKITCRQTRAEQPKEQAKQGRRMIP